MYDRIKISVFSDKKLEFKINSINELPSDWKYEEGYYFGNKKNLHKAIKTLENSYKNYKKQGLISNFKLCINF